MEDRRQAFRREPIVIELAPDDEIRIDPIPWEAANDFGNEVIRQHATILNEALIMYTDPETGTPQLEMKLTQKYTDPRRLLELGLPEETFEQIKSRSLYENQVTAILLAIAEINNLKQLYPLLDPNSQTPTEAGGIVTRLLAGAVTDQTASGPSSSSPDSTEEPSETSPDPK